MKPAKILFFINGTSPTDEDFDLASQIPANVVFRNARAVPNDGCLEECDGVIGCVPNRYAEAYDDAETAVKKKFEELQALRAKVGDEPAPQRPAKVTPKAQAPATAAKPASAQPAAPATPSASAAAPQWQPNKS